MASESSVRLGVLVTENVSLLSILLIYEPLRAANRLSGRQLFDVQFLSVDGESTTSSNNFPIPVNGTIADARALDVVVLGASYELPLKHKEILFNVIKRHARHGAMIWAIDHGVAFLAEAKLIGERKASAHWEQIPSILERWPDLKISEQLYVCDGKLMTCGGHTASLDMTLSYLANNFGESLARAVADEMLCSGLRSPESPQRHVSVFEPWREQPVLQKAVEIMEANIEAPWPIEQVSSAIGVSRRQLEYLTQRHLSRTPQQHYLSIRLHRARELLLYSRMSITEVAIACGFRSVSSFSRCFHRELNCTPTTYRTRFLHEFARPYVMVE